MSDRKQDIRGFVVDSFLFGQTAGLADDTSLLEEAIIDSTGVLELVNHLETTYGIKVNNAELVPANLDSINAIAAFLERKLPNAGGTG